MIERQIEEKVLAAIDLDAMLKFLCDLVAIRSLNGADEENTAQRRVAALMETWGFEVDLWDLDFTALRAHPAYSVETERERGLGVVGSLGAGEGPSLIYNGHVDVVPVDDPSFWHYPPWQGSIANGRVYGRGALDMKGGLCCALFAARALQQSGVTLAGRLMIESVIGEEDGGVGTLAAVLRGYRADGAVIMEPTGLCIAPSQAGALNFRVTVPGKTAHGAMRGEGVSAIEKFIPLHEALLEFEAERNRVIRDPYYSGEPLPFALNIGNIRAGEWASNVPESLVFEGRFGVAPGEDDAAARRAFENVLLKAAGGDPWLREHLPRLEWWGAQFLPARTDESAPIVKHIKAAFQEASGADPVVKGMTYGADMRLLVNQADTPTVLFGPGDIRRAHQPDEYVPVADLEVVVRTLALTALRFCGVKP